MIKLSTGKLINISEIVYITGHCAEWMVQFKSGQFLELTNDEKTELEGWIVK